MIRFNCDYNEGAHERILERMMETNREQTEGYGMDPYCKAAAEKILELCEAPEAKVHFLVGGTQTNLTMIAAALRPHQGVVAAVSGHINVHETGAIEACGHKVLPLESVDGKVKAEQIEQLCAEHYGSGCSEHTVQPKMVYLSQPTELGTMYSLNELEEIAQACKKNRLFLYVDGARLGYGLASEGNTVELPDLARLCDAFYIGGTKVGALFGEAVVITNPVLNEDFRYLIKQKGGMLAKGRLLGIQFLTLFEDGLYMELSNHAARLADRLRAAFREAGVPFWVENNTNQLFPVLPDAVLEELQKKYCYEFQHRVDESHCVVRFCTSWATKTEAVEELEKDLKTLLG